MGPIKETERGPEGLEKETETQSSISSVKVTEAATAEGQSETVLLSEVQKQPSVTVTEETSQPTPCTADNKDQSEVLSKKKKKRKTSELKPEVTEAAGEDQTPVGTEREADAPVSGKTKKKKGADGIVAESQVSAEAEITLVSSEVSAEKITTLETDATTPAKKKKKGVKAKKNLEEAEGVSQVNDESIEADFPSIPLEDSAEDGPTVGLEQSAPVKRKSKKKNLKASEALRVEADAQSEVEEKDAEIPSVGEESSQDATAVPLKKKTKGKQDDTTLEASPAADESAVTPLKTKRKKNQKESKTTVEEEGAAAETPQVANAEKVLFEITMTTPTKKKKKNQKLAAAQLDEIKDHTQLHAADSLDAELPLGETEALSSSGKPAKRKKMIPVVFEFEADELEAAAQDAASINGLAGVETVAKKTKLSSVSIK